MRLSIVLMASTLALAACGSETSGEFTTEDGETGEYTLDSESGETSASITTPDGEVTMRSGAEVPVNLPSGFSLYPGAKVITNTVVNQSGETGSLLMFESDGAPEEIATFYKQQAEAAGIDIQIDATINGSRMVAGETADGTAFSVNASRNEGDITTAQLMVGQKMRN